MCVQISGSVNVRVGGSVGARWAASGGSPLRPDILIPVVMGCAMLWWVSRGMTWTTRLVVAAVTLGLIVGVLLFERSGF
jgi:hypothetical protein